MNQGAFLCQVDVDGYVFCLGPQALVRVDGLISLSAPSQRGADRMLPLTPCHRMRLAKYRAGQCGWMASGLHYGQRAATPQMASDGGFQAPS